MKHPHPPFNAAGYSLDTFLPIVSFGQEDAWTQREGTLALQAYTWAHIAIGWVLTTLGVLGVTGLVRRD